MSEQPLPLAELHARLVHELGIPGRQDGLTVDIHGGVAVLSGEVEEIGVKRRATRIACELFGADRVEDRLTVRPAQAREDGAISAALSAAFLDESVYRRFSLNLWRKEQISILRDVPASMSEGHLDLMVDEGIVTLSGEVWSLSHSRLAEVMAWWIPGVRCVSNHIAIVPEESDNDDEITDAVRLALEKDPLVHSEQIRVTTRNGVVILEGLVRGPEERHMAEVDVWFVASGATGISNQIQVQSREV